MPACSRQTDGQTHDDSNYNASIASRGKNVEMTSLSTSIILDVKRTQAAHASLGWCCRSSGTFGESMLIENDPRAVPSNWSNWWPMDRSSESQTPRESTATTDNNRATLISTPHVSRRRTRPSPRDARSPPRKFAVKMDRARGRLDRRHDPSTRRLVRRSLAPWPLTPPTPHTPQWDTAVQTRLSPLIPFLIRCLLLCMAASRQIHDYGGSFTNPSIIRPISTIWRTAHNLGVRTLPSIPDKSLFRTEGNILFPNALVVV